jgi:ABC-type polysaccharide/polyol phosphate export permease
MVMRILFLLSPVMYEGSRVPERFHIFLVLNPFSAFIEDTRAVLWGQTWPSVSPMLVGVPIALLLWACALLLLQRVGRKVVKVL